MLERQLAADAYHDADLVFSDEIGRPIHPQRLSAAFKRHRQAAGLPPATMHILRHTATTLALSSGIPLHVVATRIGDRLETLLRTYAHLLRTSDAEAADRLAALIAGERPVSKTAANPHG